VPFFVLKVCPWVSIEKANVKQKRKNTIGFPLIIL